MREQLLVAHAAQLLVVIQTQVACQLFSYLPQLRSSSKFFFLPFSTMASATVYISIYNPTDERDPSHWAIFLSGSGSSVILQVGDDKHGVGYYVEEPIHDKQPQKSSRHNQSIAVGAISSSNFDQAVSTIQSTPVDNTSKTWNCQAWAVEALDRLSDAGTFRWDPRAKATALAKRQNWQ